MACRKLKPIEERDPQAARILEAFDRLHGLDSEGVAVGPALKPYGRQKEWLTPELLHSAPAAQFCMVNGRHGAQLDHPGGGPLSWVRCPPSVVNVCGVRRVDGKWHWLLPQPAGGRKAASKSSQGGWGAPDFTGAITGLVIAGIVIGAAASVGVPWLWGMLKPWLHAVTA